MRVEPRPGSPPLSVAGRTPMGGLASARRREGRLATTACPGSGPASTPRRRPSEGKVPFTGVCRRCHSDNLEGSERGPGAEGRVVHGATGSSRISTGCARRSATRCRPTIPAS